MNNTTNNQSSSEKRNEAKSAKEQVWQDDSDFDSDEGEDDFGLDNSR